MEERLRAVAAGQSEVGMPANADRLGLLTGVFDGDLDVDGGPLRAAVTLTSFCDHQCPPKSPACMTPVTLWPSAVGVVEMSSVFSSRMRPCMAWGWWPGVGSAVGVGDPVGGKGDLAAVPFDLNVFAVVDGLTEDAVGEGDEEGAAEGEALVAVGVTGEKLRRRLQGWER